MKEINKGEKEFRLFGIFLCFRFQIKDGYNFKKGKYFQGFKFSILDVL